MDWSSLLTLVFIGLMFFMMMRHGGGCCGGGHSQPKNHREDPSGKDKAPPAS